MKKKIIFLLIFFCMMWVYPKGLLANEEIKRIDLVLKGELYRDVCFSKNSVYYIAEFYQGEENSFLHEWRNKKVEDLALSLDSSLLYDKATNTLLITNDSNNGEWILTERDQEVTLKIADNKWMFLNSKEELAKYFSDVLNEPLLSRTVEDTFNFIESATDWYSTYKFEKLTVLSLDVDYKVLGGSILEIENELIVDSGNILLIMKEDPEGRYKIENIKIIWSEE